MSGLEERRPSTRKESGAERLRSTISAVLSDPGVGFELNRLDIAFLISIDDEMLVDGVVALAFARLVEIYEAIQRQEHGRLGDAGPRADREIGRMIQSRVLLEHASAPTRAQRRYKLGPIGRAAARTYSLGETLEANRITAVLRRIRLHLGEMLGAADQPGPTQWDEIHRNLEFDLVPLLNDIDQRRVNLDYRQDRLKLEIPALIERWSPESAPEACEEKLGQALQAARELKDCIIDEQGPLRLLLAKLADGARGEHERVSDLAERMEGDITRLSGWAAERLGAWAGYHRQVTQFVGEMIRIDPDRVLARVLKTQIRHFAAAARQPTGDFVAPYSLPYVVADRPRRLREAERPEIGRRLPASLDEPPVTPPSPDPLAEFDWAVRERVRAQLEREAMADLHVVLAPYAHLPAAMLSRLAGRTIELMAELGTPDPFDAAGTRRPLSPQVTSDTLRIARRTVDGADAA